MDLKFWVNIASVNDAVSLAELAEVARTAGPVRVEMARGEGIEIVGQTERYTIIGQDLWAECAFTQPMEGTFTPMGVLGNVEGKWVVVAVLLTTLSRTMIEALGMRLPYAEALKYQQAKRAERGQA